MQANKQTNRQTNKETNNKNKQTKKQTNKQTDKQTNKQTKTWKHCCREGFCASPFFLPMRFLKPNLDLVIIMQSVQILQRLTNLDMVKSHPAGATCFQHPC